jgi:hypothetical protein
MEMNKIDTWRGRGLERRPWDSGLADGTENTKKLYRLIECPFNFSSKLKNIFFRWIQ